jgi:hypothetical protein
VDKNTTVVFPAPLMSTIGELANFLAREARAASAKPAASQPSDVTASAASGQAVGNGQPTA